MAAVMFACLAGFVMAQSKYASGATAAGAAVNFKAKSAGWTVKAISAECGANDKDIELYARKEQAYNPQAVSAYSSKTCTVVNTGVNITNSDLVVYQHVDGNLDYTTVSSATATQIVLTDAITGSYASGDKIYEIGQIGNINAGITNVSGVASVVEHDAVLIVTPKDSPLRVLMDGGTNNVVTVTAE